jgi:epoxyqueuosine reductase
MNSLFRTLAAFFAARPRVLEWGVVSLNAPPPNAANLGSWVAEGLHANLGYMEEHVAKRQDPAQLVPWAKSVVLFSLKQPAPFGTDTGEFQVAAYALGEDYHHVARRILKEVEVLLCGDASTSSATPIRFQGFCDTMPVFERDWAAEAGLGWRGKNACLIHKKHGSGFLLAGFFLDVDLEAAPAPVPDFCGGCTACLDACPTDAFVAPGRLDANKCISYWTIEAKGAIPRALSEKFGDRIYGCDVCQEVCPWNHKHKAKNGVLPEGAPVPEPVEGPPEWPRAADEWLGLLRKGGGFQSRFKNAPLPRAGRRSLLRNVLVALRNTGKELTPEWRAILEAEEDDPVIRGELGKMKAER